MSHCLRHHLASLSDAEEENGQSHIHLGIHWAFDETEGIAQGRRVADYMFANAFVPLARGSRRLNLPSERARPLNPAEDRPGRGGAGDG